MSATSEINLLDEITNECPYPAYDELRESAPVYFDPVTNMYVLTRYEDVQLVLRDNKRFSNTAGRARADRSNAQALELYQTKGWVPAPTLGVRDEPDHQELRSVFAHALRPKRIRELDDFAVATAHSLIDAFIADGQCDFVNDFAVQLPLRIILRQMGVPDEDLWRIKGWIDAWTQRLSWSQTQEEVLWSVEQEIEAQQYFQPYFERLREVGEDTLLSDLVRTEIPNWGRRLNDSELHAEMMSDTFVGGGETAQGAIAHAMQYLIEYPQVQAALRQDSSKIAAFVEEILRMESPAQGLFRSTTEDVEMHGVLIPAGSAINIRFAAANRDEREFGCPAEFKLDRKNGRRHLAFGGGTHACIGAPLARMEITVSVQAILDRMSRMWLLEDRPTPRHARSYVLHALTELNIGFTPSR